MKIIEETKQNIQHQKDENLLLEDRLRTYKEQLAEKSSVVKSTQDKIERMKDSLGVPKQDYEKVKSEVEKIKAETTEKEAAYEQLKIDN